MLAKRYIFGVSLPADARMKNITPTEARLLGTALDEGRREIRLPADEEALRSVTPNYKRTLQHLASKGVVHRINRGQYLISEIGATTSEESAPWPVLLDVRMRTLAPYYISYFTGLEQHGLTDHASDTITVAVLGRNAGSARAPIVAGRQVIVARQARRDRFQGSTTVYEGHGSYQLGLRERVLLDALDHPELSGGPETVTRAWSRAVAEGIDTNLLIELAAKLSNPVIQRAGLMLSLLRQEDAGEALHQHLGVNPRAVSLFGGDHESAERDKTWRVFFDIPRRTVLGWMAYER